jgi:hypothetical protein
MAVLSFREIVGRTFTHRFGESPTAERKVVLTLDNTAPTAQECINAVGIFHGSPHPEYPFMLCTDATVAEATPSAFHAEITYRYEIPPGSGSAGFEPNPLARPDVWSFSTGGSAVPALFYWDGATQKPLVNSAGEFIEGLVTDEAECRATIQAIRFVFPLATAVAVTNTVNASPYLGAPAHHWKCVGIAGQQQSEMVNGVEVGYWSITTELVYRQTGWNLQLPDVGFNYLESGQTKRAWVIDPDTQEKVPAVTKQALYSDGSLKPSGQLPDILDRRVNREVNFSTYFGTPSWL